MYQIEGKKKEPATKRENTVPSRITAPLQLKIGMGIIQRELAPIKNTKELAAFLIHGDIETIRKYCMEKSYIVSFREAGEYTIRRLMDGAAAKGHHILEKSIKEGSIGTAHIASIPDEVRGLVGVWDKGKKGLDALLGLYMSEKGIAKMEESSRDSKGISQFAHDGQKVLFESLSKKLSVGATNKPMILSTIAAKLRDSKDTQLEYSDFITGDYDLHDVLYVQRDEIIRGALITPALAVKEGLNEVLNGTRRPHSEFDRVQHGPQSDYGRFMTGHRKEELNPDLLRPDVGGDQEKRIAACGPDGVWYILHDRDELGEYYGKWRLNANIVWPIEEKDLKLREKSIRVVRGE